jgi:hypothetical protein
MQDLDIIGLLTRPGTYILATGIYILVFFIRKIVEVKWPSLKKQADANDPKITYLTTMSRWWNEVILGLLPVMFGGLSGLIKSDFLFSSIGDRGGKILFGLGVGWFSGFLYKLLWKLIKQKSGLDITPGTSISPPSNE